MALQTARYVVKELQKATSGKPAKGAPYLNDLSKLLTCVFQIRL